MAHTNQLNEFVINSNIQNGTIVGNRYELVRPIGSGSFGDVWEAFDLLNGHLRVAIKLLHAGRSASEVRTRFARECSALELLIPNQHIVAIRERGIHVDRDYMVMELLEGPTLKEWLHGGGSTKLPDVSVVVSILEQICEGVAAAHSVKSPGPIVHRDLKPENIILLPIVEARQPTFQAKILDFGLARLGDSRISFLGQQLGTPLYMAPEQVLGEERDIGPWTDVFALGVILIEMLTLKPTGPEERSLRGMVAKLGKRTALRFLEQQRTDVPRWLWEIALRALSTQFRERFQDAGEMLTAIRTAQRSESMSNPKRYQYLRASSVTRQIIAATMGVLLGIGGMRIAFQFTSSNPACACVSNESLSMCESVPP